MAPSGADAGLLRLWLHGRAPNTARAYERESARFLTHAGKPLASVTLADCQAFSDSLSGLAPASVARSLAALKSLLAFGHRLGLLPVNAGAALRLPSIRDQLAERILPEADILRMIAGEPNDRNRAILRTLYAGGLRVSEVSALRWADLQPRREGGQLTIFGKGGKSRAVLLPASAWVAVWALRPPGAARQGPVFRSRNGGHLATCQIGRVVRAAAVRVGIDLPVSAHWYRHAHASHSLDRGAPISLVQQTLGHSSVATTSHYLHARPNDSSGRYLPE